jgi:hypothetical protein
LQYHFLVSNIYFGNAKDDSEGRRGWVIGAFISQEQLRHSDTVEVKYGIHSKGEKRSEWVTGEERTALFILQSGRVAINFRDRDVVLERPGDYVMWGARHRPSLGGAR